MTALCQQMQMAKEMLQEFLFSISGYCETRVFQQSPKLIFMYPVS